MAKGISESDVHHAADALVVAGERPTVERVRAHLGTGSPNTVIRWLDTWWGTLGERLAAREAKLALPNAPADVVALASQWWTQALEAARGEAERAVASERTALEAQRHEFAELEGGWQAQIHQHAAEAEQAQQLLASAEQRLADASRLAERQTRQLDDLQRQRDRLQERLDHAAQQAQAHTERWEAANTAAATERDGLLQQLRGLEERSAGEIDRAREDAKVVRKQLEARTRQAANAEAAWQARLAQAEQGAIAAQRQAAAQLARAEALEPQLERLHAQLKAALAKPKNLPQPAAKRVARSRR